MNSIDVFTSEYWRMLYQHWGLTPSISPDNVAYTIDICDGISHFLVDELYENTKINRNTPLE
jgi:hypothetical protein